MNHSKSSQHTYQMSLARILRGKVLLKAANTALEKTRVAVLQSRVSLLRELPTFPCEESAGKMMPSPVDTKASHDTLQTISDLTFEGQVVVLDGKHFINCVLRNCTLRYSGYPVVLESTHFEGCEFQFGDHAAMTMQLAECFGLIGRDAPEFGYGRVSSGAAIRLN